MFLLGGLIAVGGSISLLLFLMEGDGTLTFLSLGMLLIGISFCVIDTNSPTELFFDRKYITTEIKLSNGSKIIFNQLVEASFYNEKATNFGAIYNDRTDKKIKIKILTGENLEFGATEED